MLQTSNRLHTSLSLVCLEQSNALSSYNHIRGCGLGACMLLKQASPPRGASSSLSESVARTVTDGCEMVNKPPYQAYKRIRHVCRYEVGESFISDNR